MLRIYNGRILTTDGFDRGEIWCANGKIVPPQAKSEYAIDAHGLIIAPGYIDLQINGAYGVDFTTNPEKVGEVARKLPLHGVTSFLPTLVSAPKDEYRRLINMLQPRPVARGASILGVHLEGPFFNPLYRGAHAIEHLAVLDEQANLSAFYGTLKGVKMITCAPELPHMLEAIEKLKSQKIIFALGHSCAPLKVVQAAIRGGASLITHLFNGMQPLHHRLPSLIDAALIHPCMNYTLICDGTHVYSQAVKLAWKLNPMGLILVSDAMEALGLPLGMHHLGRRRVEVQEGGAYIQDTQTLAGSVMGIDACVRHLWAVTGCTVQQAIEAATLRPAQLLGISDTKGTLTAGADADFIFLDDALNVRATYVLGQHV